MADSNYDPDRLMTDRPTGTPMMTVRPRKLDRDDAEKLVRKYNPDITQAAVKGEVDNIVRESGGNAANDTGDHGTSGGLYQHHNERLAGLKSFATKEKADWRDPDIQVRYSRLEKERDYPALLKLQQTSDDRGRNEDAFKRIFERPASVLWGNDAGGQPVLGNDRYRFSDYAMKEHDGRKNTDMLMMTPAEYLDLSPELGGKPFESPSGRSLKKSFDRGDAIEAVPTLDVNVDGPTATVTDQDGRHRALLAQQEGIDAIPVAVRRTGDGEPKEIVGVNGVPMAHDFPKASEVKGRQPRQETQEQPKEPISLLGRIGEAIIPKAEAAEPKSGVPSWMADAVPVEEAPQAKSVPDWMKGAVPVGAQQGQPSSAWERFGTGIKDPVLGVGQMVAHTMPDAGRTALEAMPPAMAQKLGGVPTQPAADVADQAVRDREAAIQAGRPADAGVDWPRAAGNVVGTLPLALLNPMAAGAASAGAQPVTGPDYAREKAKQIVLGGAFGKAGQVVGNALANMTAPALSAGARMLADMGVTLTPGQILGGVAQRAENALNSLPLVGSMIRSAQRKSLEDFNKATLDHALEPIGASVPMRVPAGRESIEYAQRAASDAYDRVLSGVTFHADHQLAAEMTNLKTLISEMPPAHREQFATIFNNRVLQRLQPTGTMDGLTFKQVESELTHLANGFRRSMDMADKQLGTALGEVKDSMREALERTNPGKRAELEAANRTYAMLSRAEDASMVRSTEDGVFTPADLLRAIKADAKRTGRRKAFARGDAMMQDLAEAGQSVLKPMPDSHTAERGMWAGLVTGHLLKAPDLIAGGLAALPYSKAGLAAANWLAQRPGAARNALADMFREAPQYVAPATGAAAGDAFSGR